jgi:4-diphosphocytidyl-2-C-methyl-D-erythritol kinase
MIMQSVSLADTLTVSRGEGGLTCSDPAIPTDARNIACKAVFAFEKATGTDCSDAHIHIEKRIPSAAGLAGGSADGAAVLAALDRLYGTHLPAWELRRIGAQVGADVPFCLEGGTCLAQNIGDVLSPLPPLRDVTILLAKPDCAVSTAEAYAEYDETQPTSHIHFPTLLSDAAKGEWDRVLRGTCNVFEQFIEVADRVPIKTAMRRHGSRFAMMSGSGPTVFGLFDSAEDAQSCAEELRGFVPDVFVCSPTAQGLEITEE